MDDDQLPQNQNKPQSAADDAKAVADIERQNGNGSSADASSKDPLAGSNGLRTREDYLSHYDDDRPKKGRRFLRFLGWMLLIIVLVGGIGGAGWYFWLRNEPKPADNAQTTDLPTTSDQKETEEADPTETFSSTAFQIQFDYPATWKAADGPNNTIVATSPSTKLQLLNGKTQSGQVVVTVQHKQISLPEFKTGAALAVRESEKINYKKPSQVQRASTYLSFLSYASSAGKGVDGVYITGDFGYVKDQYVPQEDVTKADPLVTVTFRSCSDDKCTSVGETVALATNAWDDAGFTKPIKTLLESIVILQ